jgi:hypothetical protein
MEASMMQLDDETFVRQAYLRLLGRSADPEGFAGYLGQLRQGAARADIYQELASSDEAQRYEARRQALRRTLSVVQPVRQQPQGGGMVVTPQQWLPALQVPQWDGPTQSVANVNELLELEGTAFIKAAYLALLGREVDEEGGNNYVRRLRDGWTKMSLVKGLALSDEGKAHGMKLAGLRKALARYAKAQRRSWAGWYTRSVLGVESDLPLERQLRAANMALRRD